VAGSLAAGGAGTIAGTATGLYQVVKGNQVEDAIYEKLIENDKQNQSLREGEEFNRIGTYEEFLNTFSSELEGTTDAYKKSMYETAKAAEDQLEQNRLTMI
jgi:hypothetical protein